MEIGDIMTQPVQTVSVVATAQEAAERMARFNVGALLVRSEERVVGIITDRDLLVRCMAEGRSPATTPIGGLMTVDPITVGPREPIEKAVEIFEAHRFRRLPVVEDSHLIGILSVADIARKVKDNELIVRAVRRPARPGSAVLERTGPLLWLG
jgi:CBS domain-containing protein